MSGFLLVIVKKLEKFIFCPNCGTVVFESNPSNENYFKCSICGFCRLKK